MAKTKVDLEKENAKLQKQNEKLQNEVSKHTARIHELESDLNSHKSRVAELEAAQSQSEPEEESWERSLKRMVRSNPEAAKQALAESNGFPNNYTDENLFQHVHDRAVAFGPTQFIERIQNIIDRG